MEHFIIRANPDGYGTTICGVRIRLADVPNTGTDRCPDCTAALEQVARAHAYANERGITPTEAAAALNMDTLVRMAVAQ